MVGKTAREGFQRPDVATRMRDILTQIAQDVADGKASYRMATVTTITPTTLEVEFTDEPGTTIELTNLPTFRPAAAGQMVEVLVRDRTQFTLWRVVGPTIMYDVTQFVPAPTDGVSGLVLTTANRAVVASWDMLDGATSYDVDRAKDSGFTTARSTVTVTGTQHTATNLTPGDGWYYRIRGRNDNGTGPWSGTLSIVVGTDTPAPTTPAVPGTPVVTNGELSQSITWATSATADHYELQWSQSATFASGITTQVVQGNVFVRNGLTKDNTWYYRVRAINTGGTSAYSAISAGATVVTGVPAPAGVPVQVVGVAASSAERAISVVWTPQAVATSYEMERSKSATFASGNVLQELAGSTITINNLIAGEAWYFRVRAKNAAGTGPYSAILGPITVNTDTPVPGAPAQVTGLALTTIPRQITAKWNIVSEAESYQIDRSPDSTFVTGTITETSETNALVVSNLDPGTTWYFRVRGINSTGNGTYSASANIAVMLQSAYTDGDVPSSSPACTVTAGIGILTATWPVTPNDDPVTYEVFISTTTGFTTYDATTKLGETSGTFWITDKLPSGTKLAVGTTYYMRVRAKDNDGVAAVAGAQGSAQLVKVDLGAAGDLKYAQVTGNGAVPATPAAPVVTSGIGYLYATWTRPASPDPLTYEVHVGTSAGFAPDANTLSVVTDSLFAFVRKQGPGAAGADLVYGTTYYIKIIAKDVDGVSAASPAGSGFTVKANTADIAVNAITAASGIIADLAIGTAKIADAAITTVKIGDAQISTAKIGDLQVATAKIADGAILTAKIGDLQVTTAKVGDAQITNAKIGSVQASKITTDTLTATLTVSGVVRTSAGTARVEMSSAGLYAYNSGGGTIFSLDHGGNAYFYGNVYAVNGTFTGSITSSATITGGALYGAYIATASSGARIGLGPVNTTGTEMGYGYARGPFPGLEFRNGSGTLRASMFMDTENDRVTWEAPGSNHTAMTIADDGFDIYGSGLTVWGWLGYGANQVYSGGTPPPYPVSSVNGYTGAVNLNYTHVGAAASSHSHSYYGDGSSTNFYNMGYQNKMYRSDSATSWYIQQISQTGIYVGDNNAFRGFSVGSVAAGQTKNFVIEHPLDDDLWLVHACLEGPTADVYYRGQGSLKPDNGKMSDGTVRVARAVVELPPYFEALTREEGRTVQITPVVGFCEDDECDYFLPPSMGAGPVKDGKFTVYSIGGLAHDCADFYWEVKAIRKDVEPLVAEPHKKDVTVYGDGPYTYLMPA